MPMWRSFTRAALRVGRDRRGVAAIEFAIVMPAFLIVSVLMIDIGRALYQTNAVAKALQAGALFAARSAYPLTTTAQTQARNLVKTGNTGGTLPYLVSGWGKAGAELTITTHSTAVGTDIVRVYTFAATVPFDPILPGLVSDLVLGGSSIMVTHEQAYLGL